MKFITGATGFLGREVLSRHLLSGGPERIAVLIRPRRGESAEERLRAVLSDVLDQQQLGEVLSNVEVFPGDVTLENFGLDFNRYQQLARRVTTIYHVAASTALGASLAQSREINVGGTARVMGLVKTAHQLGNLSVRLRYVSTAYVAGERDGVVCPSELRLDHGFRNPYERSKAEAEQLVREGADKISTVIFRPSLIVGDSRTGKTSAFNVIYVPARVLARGLCAILPAGPNVPCDVVPVNYVADAILELGERDAHFGENPTGYQVYHLCSGVGRETSPREMMDFLVRVVNAYRVRGKMLLAPPIIPLEFLSRAYSSLTAARESVKHIEEVVVKRLGLIRELIPCLPYMNRNPRFDVTVTTAALAGILHPPPLFREYAERIFGYCLETNWGRRLLPDAI